jgi:hypothetical protein
MKMEKQSRLVDSLLKRTKGGSLEWKPALDDGAFQVSFKDNTVRVRLNNTGTSTTYYIDLINAEGTTVESFHDGELDEDAGFEVNTKWYGKMGELYELARRNALGSDKILDAILNDLNGDVPF